MSKKAAFITVGLILLVSFLAGYFLRNNEIRQLRAELAGEQDRLEGAQQQLQKCQFQARLSGIRDLAAFMYLQTAKNNFDEAARLSTRFFDQVRQVSDLSADAALKNEMEKVLAERDRITAQLAKAEASARDSIQELMEKTFKVTDEG